MGSSVPESRAEQFEMISDMNRIEPLLGDLFEKPYVGKANLRAINTTD